MRFMYLVIVFIACPYCIFAQSNQMDSIPTAKPSIKDSGLVVKPSGNDNMPVANPENISPNPANKNSNNNKKRKRK